jgi:hypothetical protein
LPQHDALEALPLPQEIQACPLTPLPFDLFQAVDPDNTDGYQATGNTGFATTAADTLNFLTFLSTQARAQGLSIGLKNTLELIAGNVGLWDFAVNEQCYDWTECNYYTPFQTGKSAARMPCIRR